MADHHVQNRGEGTFVQEGGRNQTPSEFDVVLAKGLAKRTERLQDHSIDIAIRAKESREFLDWHVTHLKSVWCDWLDQSDKIFLDIKQTRAAIEFESKALLAACGDVRKFFLSEEHAREVERLKEFVSVMERLQTLKQDGTLDAISDTILRLATSEKAPKPNS